MGNRNHEQNAEMYAIARNIAYLEDRGGARGDEDFVAEDFRDEVELQAVRLKRFILSPGEKELMRNPKHHDGAVWVMKDRLDGLYAEFGQ